MTDRWRPVGPMGSPNQMWVWRMPGVPAPDEPARGAAIRIGDVERDQAITALSDHFAAGRLTREELDERVDQAMAARVQSDLAPLFADLPRSEPRVAAQPTGRRPDFSAAWLPLYFLGPLLLIGTVVLAAAFSAPWLIWTFIWIFMITGLGRARWHRGGHHHP